VWLLACFAVLAAVGVPWYLRLLDIELAPVAWSLFAYGLIYVFTSAVADGFHSRRSLLTVIASLQATGVLFIGWIWHATGSLQNPMFAALFVLPVVAGSLVLVSWYTYGTAALSIATVLAVALIDVPELRWYVAQSGPSARRAMALLPTLPLSRSPFPGTSLPPSYMLALLLLLVILIVTVALLTESFTTLLARLYGRVESSITALARAETLSSNVLQASPFPAALVYADTFRIARASASFFHHMMLRPDDLLSKNLFTVVGFTYPEVIESLMTGSGGSVPLAAYRVGGELRVASVRVDPINHGGRRYAYVTLQDVSDSQYLQMALNALDTALLVIGAGEVRYFNRAAKGMFEDLEPGMNAGTPLRRGSLPDGWWELNARSRQERVVEFDGERYAASCVAARILGERDALTVVSLQLAAGDR